MTDYREIYKRKFTSPEEAAKLVKPGMCVDFG